MNHRKSILLVLLGLGLVGLCFVPTSVRRAAAADTTNYVYIPSPKAGIAPETDGRFLCIAGTGLNTLGGQAIGMSINALPTLKDPSDILIDVFDPDSNGL